MRDLGLKGASIVFIIAPWEPVTAGCMPAAARGHTRKPSFVAATAELTSIADASRRSFAQNWEAFCLKRSSRAP